MKTINLNGKYGKGKYALVDDTDFERINKFNWHVNDQGYAVRSKWFGDTKKKIRMHREVLGVSPFSKEIVDHINADKLDNQRMNLRKCSQCQNLANMMMRKRNKSGYKGVSWNKASRKWVVQLKRDKKYYYLGVFNDKRRAVVAYDKFVLSYDGVFARTNIL